MNGNQKLFALTDVQSPQRKSISEMGKKSLPAALVEEGVGVAALVEESGGVAESWIHSRKSTVEIVWDAVGVEISNVKHLNTDTCIIT